MSVLARSVMLLTIGVMVPFAEEMMFRGVLLKACSRWMGPIMGIVVSSAFFGYLHAEAWVAPQLAHALWAAWAGVVFACLRVGTDRLGAGIIAHAIQNSIVVALALASAH
jgi:membrane protease YdiL (CAAX protease family)